MTQGVVAIFDGVLKSDEKNGVLYSSTHLGI
jgi:hypothetical protein